jgi:PKD repeat protein
MKTALLLIALAGSAAAAPDKEEADADFSGSYTYTGTYTISLTAPVQQTFTDSDDGHLTITTSKKGGFVLTFTAKGETCQLSAARSGKTGIKLAAGQTCEMVDKDSRADLTLTLTSGTGTLNGDSLTMNCAWKVSGSVAGVAVTGRATESIQAESK